MNRPNGLFVLDGGAMARIYGPEELRDITRLVHLVGPAENRESIIENRKILSEVEVIFSGWGAPAIDEAFLNAAPQLKVIFYGAGAVSNLVSDDLWDRGIVVTSAYAANAVPVAEYTLGMILISLKRVWHYARRTREHRDFRKQGTIPGAYGTTVGLLSLGVIGRKVLELLQSFDIKVIAYDPYLTPEDVTGCDVEMVGIEEIFARADVVSVHTPWLPETSGLVTGRLMSMMKPNSTFINTSRGALVCETEMVEVLAARPDLQAILDVTYPEPPQPDSLLYTLPNVVLTPHLAGSQDVECRRMGRYMVEELQRYLAGKPLKWMVTRELAANSTHRPQSRNGAPTKALFGSSVS